MCFGEYRHCCSFLAHMSYNLRTNAHWRIKCLFLHRATFVSNSKKMYQEIHVCMYVLLDFFWRTEQHEASEVTKDAATNPHIVCRSLIFGICSLEEINNIEMHSPLLSRRCSPSHFIFKGKQNSLIIVYLLQKQSAWGRTFVMNHTGRACWNDYSLPFSQSNVDGVLVRFASLQLSWEYLSLLCIHNFKALEIICFGGLCASQTEKHTVSSIKSEELFNPSWLCSFMTLWGQISIIGGQ